MFICPWQPGLSRNRGDVHAWAERVGRTEGGKGRRVELNALAEPREGCTCLITRTVGCVIVPRQTPVTAEISARGRKREKTNDSTLQNSSSRTGRDFEGQTESYGIHGRLRLFYKNSRTGHHIIPSERDFTE